MARSFLLLLALSLAACQASGTFDQFGVSESSVVDDDDATGDDDDATGDDDDATGDDDDATGDDDDATGDDDDATGGPGSVYATLVSFGGTLTLTNGDFGSGQIAFSYWEDTDLQALACQQVYAIEVAQELAPPDCALCTMRLALDPTTVTDISATASDTPCPLDAFAPNSNIGRLFLNDLAGGGDFLSVGFVPTDVALSQNLGYMGDGSFPWLDYEQSIVSSGFSPVGMGYLSGNDTYVANANASGVLGTSGSNEPWLAFLGFYTDGGVEPDPYFQPGLDYNFNGIFLLQLP